MNVELAQESSVRTESVLLATVLTSGTNSALTWHWLGYRTADRTGAAARDVTVVTYTPKNKTIHTRLLSWRWFNIELRPSLAKENWILPLDFASTAAIPSHCHYFATSTTYLAFTCFDRLWASRIFELHPNFVSRPTNHHKPGELPRATPSTSRFFRASCLDCGGMSERNPFC